MASAHLSVMVTPRAGRDALAGFQGEALKIKLAAPPVDGAANLALVKFLAGLLKIPAGDISVSAGRSGRRKLLKIEGLTDEELRDRLAGHL